MLHYGTVFLIIALFAAIFGIGALAVGAEEFSGLLFIAFGALLIGGLAETLFRRSVAPIEGIERPDATEPLALDASQRDSAM
jgi:uncharacterized membrane protein YtjA (UPF0391 family)